MRREEEPNFIRSLQKLMKKIKPEQEKKTVKLEELKPPEERYEKELHGNLEKLIVPKKKEGKMKKSERIMEIESEEEKKENGKEKEFEMGILGQVFNTNESKNGFEKYSVQMEQLEKKQKSICGKILKGRDIGFKCKDCQMDASCIICKECFEKGDHKNHRVIRQEGCNGCCDCGDEMAWKKEGFCSMHKGKDAISEDAKEEIQKDWQIKIRRSLNYMFYFLFRKCEECFMATGCKVVANEQIS